MRNLDVNNGLVKNRRVVVEALHERIVKIRLIESNAPNTTFCIPQTAFKFQPDHCPWTIQRRQLPLRLAYATIFNSCQGLTLDKMVLGFRAEVFAHSQLNTSISRVRHRGACKKLISGSNQFGETRNVVYRELLLL